MLRLLTLAPVVTALTGGPSPIQRVVKLLEQMKTELGEESKKDAKLYTDLTCWCKTNVKQKFAAIKEGAAKAETLEADIQKYAGNSGEYKAKMEIAQKAVKKLEQDAMNAEKEHEQQMEQLTEEETELVKTVGALENALKVLSKHQSLLQTNPEVATALSSIVHAVSEKARILYGNEVVSQPTTAFLQADDFASTKVAQALQQGYRPALDQDSASSVLTAFLQGPAHLEKYGSGSGPVFGVLGNMKDAFEADLKKKQEEIKTEQTSYTKMKTVLALQLKSQRTAAENNKAAFGKAKYYSTEGKEELARSQSAVAADKEILRNVNMQCQDIDKQFKLRTEGRFAEQEAVDKAVEILSSDENREAVHGPSLFVQTSSMFVQKQDTAAFLQQQLASWSSVHAALSKSTAGRSLVHRQKRDLALVAAAAKLNAFTKVKELIDKMVADIKAQIQSDKQSRDMCTVEFKKNAKDQRETTRAQSLAGAAMEELNEKISSLHDSVKVARQNAAATQAGILEASQDREEGNADFQKVVSEQRDMVTVLLKAYSVLKEHYAKDKAVFVQTTAVQTPMPGQFESYRANSGSGPVLSMLEKIMADAKQTEAEAVKDESEAQASYQTFVTASMKGIEALNAEISDLQEESAEAGEDLSERKEELVDTTKLLEDLQATNSALHKDCDFVIKYFDIRQESMTTEVDALQKAKAILSGSSQK